MPDKFIVPQFIDKEDQILGPITVRQFLLMIGTCFAVYIEYLILTTVPLILFGLLTAAVGGIFAFVKINGQAFHIFFLNMLQTVARPALRVWDKTYTDAEIRAYMAEAPMEMREAPMAKKDRPESTRLRDLTLIVNTGGVYRPDDE